MDKLPEGFEEFWSIYPRRVAKQAAIRMYAKAIKKTAPANVIAATKRYANERMGKDASFTKHPATWLNGERWEDYQHDTFMMEPRIDATSVRILVDTPQWRAWQGYLLSTKGRGSPCVNFGWYFPTEWPPGFVPQMEAAE